jgi:hypothetical protein
MIERAMRMVIPFEAWAQLVQKPDARVSIVLSILHACTRDARSVRLSSRQCAPPLHATSSAFTLYQRREEHIT